MALTKVIGAGLGSVSSADLDGAVTINESSADKDFRVESNGNANMLTVNGGSDLVGIGADPDLGGGLHVKLSDSGAGVSSTYDTVVIEESGHSGIQILSGTSSTGLLGFNDSGASLRAYIAYAHSSDNMEFATAGSERMRINSNGVTSFNNGIALGVSLANTASNVLDDYEEGTFTPSAEGSTTAGTVSHTSSPVGRYTKVGRDVTIFMQLNFTLSGEAGVLRITGLPFACSTSQESVGSFQCNNMENSYASNVAHYNSIIQGGESHVHFRGTTSDGSNYHSMAANNMTYMRVSITYPTG